MAKNKKEESVELGKQRKITLHCPKCDHNFKQIGRPYNLWRDAKKNYNLSHEELRTMQKQLLRKFFKDGELKAKQTSYTSFFISP